MGPWYIGAPRWMNLSPKTAAKERLASVVRVYAYTVAKTEP